MRFLPTFAFFSLPSLLSSLPTTAETPQPKDESELLNWERLVQNGNWASVTEEYQFVRASTDPKFDGATDEAVTRFLEDAAEGQSSSSNHYSQYLKTTGTGFEYSANAEYEQYQLAWRFLGLSIDCSITSSQNDSHDDEDGDDESCARVLLYAVVGFLSGSEEIPSNSIWGAIHHLNYFPAISLLCSMLTLITMKT
jgi:hypothetical protein